MTKTLRRYLWLLTALFNRYKKLIVGAFIGGIVIFLFALRVAPFIWAEMQKEYTIMGVVGSYTPTNLPHEVQDLISSGLTTVNPDGSVTPGLAESWNVSEDGKEYIFKLRSNLLWHDGKSFSAFDVNYNVKDVDFVASDDATLVIKLKEPFTPLPSFLTKPLFRKGLVGVGPYKVIQIRLKGEYVNFLRLMPLAEGLPGMEIKFYPSESIAKTAFKLGEINRLEDISDETPFPEWNSVQIIENPKFNQFVGVFFNLDDPLLAEKEIRQALAFAIDKPEKNRITTPLSIQSWAYTNRVKQYEKDDAQATKLVGDELKDKEITLSTFPQYLHLAQTIAAAWQAIGVPTKVKVEDGIPTQYQALLATQEIPSDPDQYTLWHSTQKETNITHYQNPKIDKLLEDGRQEQDVEERQKIYSEFQRYLVDDSPAVFLFHPTTYTIVRK